MDILSEILDTLRLETGFYCRSEMTSPWGLHFPAGEVAMFHAIRRGSLWFHTEQDGNSEFVPLSVGDVVMFPHGHAHTLVDDPKSPAPSIFELLESRAPDETGPLNHGGGGVPTTLLCGKFSFERGEVHPLFSVLPNVILIKGEMGRAAFSLEATLDIIATESQKNHQGSQSVISRMTDVLFIQLIRTHLEMLPEGSEGWLRGLGDDQISKALFYIHRSPEKAWSINDLASASGMSRSSFCGKFTRLVGESPHQYLTRWRMQKATVHLKNRKLSLSDVAERVGYQTEMSFSKTFKRYVGIAPGAYRRKYSEKHITGVF